MAFKVIAEDLWEQYEIASEATYSAHSTNTERKLYAVIAKLIERASRAEAELAELKAKLQRGMSAQTKEATDAK